MSDFLRDYLSFLRAHLVQVVLCLLLFQLIRTRYRKGLRDIPGPFLASFSNLWRILVVWRSDMPRVNIRLHEQYGPIVRIGPSHVSLSDPDALKEIYSTKSIYTKTPFYTVAQPSFDGKELNNLFSTSDIRYHAQFKKATARIYTMSAVTQFEPGIDSCIKLLVSRIKEINRTEVKPMDASAWLQYFAFDTLGELNFSQSLGFLDKGKDVDGMIAIADKMIDYVSLVGQIPFMDKFILGNPILSWLFMGSEKSNQVMTFALEKINNRVSAPGDQSDILSHLIKTHESDAEKLSFREIVAVTLINIIAGHDTLAIALRSVLYYLSITPSACSKLQHEIDKTILTNTAITSPATYSSISGLPYLNAVITEAMRLNPATGLILERHVPSSGATLCNVSLPAGTIVGVNAWVIHRNRAVYGPDVEMFRPERWLEEDAERVQEMKRCFFMFGHGARACLGRNIVMMQITKLIFELYRHFNIRLADPEKSWKVCGRWLSKQTEMDMLFIPRE